MKIDAASSAELLDLLALSEMATSLLEEASILLGADALHDALTPEQRVRIKTCWPARARPLRRIADEVTKTRVAPGFGTWVGQIPPETPWAWAVFLGGRGTGKTAAAANWMLRRLMRNPRAQEAIVAATSADVWQNCVETLIRWCPPKFKLYPEISKRRVRCSNGAVARIFSADEPERFRGWNHTGAWADDLTAWARPEAAFKMLEFTLRLGTLPQCFVTCTPKPLKMLLDLVQRKTACVIRGTSYDNPYLSEGFFEAVVSPVAGTALGEQEVEGRLLDEAKGAMFKRGWIQILTAPPAFKRVVMGADPAETSKSTSDDWGLVAAGLAEGGQICVTHDRTVHDTPDAAARAAVKLYFDAGATLMVVDAARNGETFKSLVKMVNPNVRVKLAGGNKNKAQHADWPSSLYENRRVFHLQGLDALENQMTGWTPELDWSPDRMDALCAAVNELIPARVPLGQGGAHAGGGGAGRAEDPSRRAGSRDFGRGQQDRGGRGSRF